MVFVRALTEAERRTLKQGVRREVGRVSERMRAVLLSDRQFTVPQIATIFECDEVTVREWIHRFEAEGLPGLRDRPKSGRRPRATPAARERLGRVVAGGPASAGHSGGVWTTVTLTLYLVVSEGLALSGTTVRRLLLALGFRWRRPKLTLPVDPEAGAKLHQMAMTLFRAPRDAVVLALDECDVHLVPVLRAMWMRRGQQAHVLTPGTNRKRGVFGALALEGPCPGAWHYCVTERKRAAEFLAFLEQLVACYPAAPLYLVLDNASIHTAKVTRAWLEGHPQVVLCFLPSYAGHRENPVEKVWWRMKQQVTANRLYGDVEQLAAAVHHFFGAFPPEAACRLAA
jgi:transposase